MSYAEALNAPVQRRYPQYIYLLPVLGAPIAHILVSAITKYPAYKRPLLYAVGASTALMVINRLYLMGDAGYPGSEGGKDANKHWHEKITHGT